MLSGIEFNGFALALVLLGDPESGSYRKARELVKAWNAAQRGSVFMWPVLRFFYAWPA
ncbi:hypothetical protein [Thauera sp. 28]|uniref:hypothetical protein n=1 Tax=Thauera sp. 28 TaxID=303682 RepID=UPI0002FD7275|nr:hypothetical protein [Thauera sp. 28]